MPGIKTLGNMDVVAFDREDGDWGLLSNYAVTPINIATPFGNRTFPTVEHYFQYMKDPNDQAYLNLVLSNPNPQHARDEGAKHFDEVNKRNPVLADSLKTAWRRGGADIAMDTAITAKIAQHQTVRDTLMLTEKACLIEDTGSRSPRNQDGNWGWKTGGQVDKFKGVGNKLGVLLMHKRNAIHQAQQNVNMMVPNPAALSASARDFMETHYLSKNLINLPLPTRQATGARVSQASSAAASYQQRSHASSAASSASQAATQTQTAKAKVLNALKNDGVVDLAMVPDLRNPSQLFVKLIFSTPENADGFSTYAGGAPRAGNKPPENRAIIMGPDRAQFIFNKLNVGKNGPYDTFKSLVYDHQKAQQMAAAIAQTQSIPLAKDIVLGRLNPSGAVGLEVVPDKYIDNQKVIKLTFNTPQDAQHFAKAVNNAPCQGNAVFMGPDRAQIVFDKLGIRTHGRAEHPMFDALVYDAEQAKPTRGFTPKH